eukprot:scaffold909_cov575-Prasinococcus_capsulatus_cf.AAC.2
MLHVSAWLSHEHLTPVCLVAYCNCNDDQRAGTAGATAGPLQKINPRCAGHRTCCVFLTPTRISTPTRRASLSCFWEVPLIVGTSIALGVTWRAPDSVWVAAWLSLAGSDKPTLHSMVPYAKQMLASGWFNRIFWEANTIDIAGVDTYLKTMSMHYMLGREDAFLEVRHAVLMRQRNDHT